MAEGSFRQQLQWRLEAAAFDVVEWIARRFPVDAVSDFGSWLFRRVGPMTSLHRVANTNLRIAFPQAADAEIAALLVAQWDELGRSAAEFLIVDKILADPSRFEVEGGERLTAIAQGAGPVVLISGHFSTFEVMAAAIIGAGIPCHISYRAMNNPYIDERIRRTRRRYGVRLFAAKGQGGAREMMRALGRGESVALLNDQKFNGGVAAPFFGVTVHTAPGPSTYARRFDVPLQPLSVQRRGKASFKVIAHEPIHVPHTADRDADIEAAVRQVNAFVEDRVRARPNEWWWVHKRWPKEHYKKR